MSLSSGHRLGLPFVCAWMCLIFAFCFSSVSVGDPSFDSQTRPSTPKEAQEESFQRGLLALKENRLEDSLEALTAAEREHPSDGRVHNFRGIVLTRLGKNAEAAAEYREAIRLYPRLGMLIATWDSLSGPSIISSKRAKRCCTPSNSRPPILSLITTSLVHN